MDEDTDVVPVLSYIKSDEEERKIFVIPVIPERKHDSEASVREELVLPVHHLGYLAAGDVGQPQDELNFEEADDEDRQADQQIPVQENITNITRSEKKARVQVDPNASVKDIEDNVHYLSALPVVPEDSQPYIPILYTFRVKPRGKVTKLKNITTKPPPFYLQFDHAIAVIWTLFNKNANKDNLGIVQLQWALYFLESLYNSEGVHPKDVQLCIDTIQDYLIEAYADISEESVIYGSSKFGDFFKEAKNKNVSFSLNYSQMINKCPAAMLDKTESMMPIMDKQLLEELENVKKVVGIDSIDLTKVVSKDQVMNILNEWKKEQIEKIQEEFKMLYVVEDMMKNSDSQNFEGYTDEKQFETIFKKNKGK